MTYCELVFIYTNISLPIYIYIYVCIYVRICIYTDSQVQAYVRSCVLSAASQRLCLNAYVCLVFFVYESVYFNYYKLRGSCDVFICTYLMLCS